jgi:hypothetical protein
MLNVDERTCAVLDVQWHREIAIPEPGREAALAYRNTACRG